MRKADGRGASFLKNNQLVDFGDWKEGKLVKREDIKALQEKDSLPNEIDLKMDSYGNLDVGNFFNHNLESYGEAITSLGSYWKGDFKDGNPCGAGLWTFTNGWTIKCQRDFDEFTNVYEVRNQEGESRTGFILRNDELEGKKKVIDEYGNMFIGYFEEGELHGPGRWLSPHGFFVEGEFDCGVLVEIDCVIDVRGEKTDLRLSDENSNDKGFYVMPDCSFYEGQLTNGKKQGFGVWLNERGDFYVGEFANNQPHGKGKYLYSTGFCIEGDFKSGKIEGKNKNIKLDHFLNKVEKFKRRESLNEKKILPTQPFDQKNEDEIRPIRRVFTYNPEPKKK